MIKDVSMTLQAIPAQTPNFTNVNLHDHFSYVKEGKKASLQYEVVSIENGVITAIRLKKNLLSLYQDSPINRKVLNEEQFTQAVSDGRISFFTVDTPDETLSETHDETPSETHDETNEQKVSDPLLDKELLVLRDFQSDPDFNFIAGTLYVITSKSDDAYYAKLCFDDKKKYPNATETIAFTQEGLDTVYIPYGFLQVKKCSSGSYTNLDLF